MFLFFSSDSSAVNIISTVAGGSWTATTTWVGAVVPGNGDDVTIQSGATVTINSNTDLISNLIIQANSTLIISNLASASLSMDGALTVNGTLTNNGRIDFLGSQAFNLTGTYTHNPRANVASDETIFQNGIENFTPASNLIIEKWSDLSIPLGAPTRVTGDFGNVTLSVPASGTNWDQDGRFAPARIKGSFTVNEGEVVMDDGTGNSTSYTFLSDILITGTGQIIWQGGANRQLDLICNNFTDNSTSPTTSRIKSISYGNLNWTVNGNLTLAHKFFVIEGTLSEPASATINVTGDFNISGDSVSILRQVTGNLSLSVGGTTTISGNPSYVRFMEGNTGVMTYTTQNFTVTGGNNNMLVGGNAAIPAPTSAVTINITSNINITGSSTTYFVNSDVNVNGTSINVGGSYNCSNATANFIAANTNGNLLFNVTGGFTITNGNFTGQAFAGNIKADSIMIGGNFLFNSPTLTNYFYGNKGAGTTGGTTFSVTGNFTIQNSGTGVGQGVYGVYQANSPLNFTVGGNFLLTQGRFNGIYSGDGNLTSVVNGSFTQVDGIYRGILNTVSQQAGIATFTANSLTYNKGQFSVFYANSLIPNVTVFTITTNCNITFNSAVDTFTVVGVELVEPSSNESRLSFNVGGNLVISGGTGTFISSKAKGREVIAITGNMSVSGGVNTFNSSLLLSLPNGHPVVMTIGGNIDVTGGSMYLSSRADTIICNVNGNVSVSNGSLSLKGGTGYAVLNINGGFSQTGGNFNIHNSTTIANTEISPATMTVNADGNGVGDFIHSAGTFTFDNNTSALSIAPVLNIKSPNYTLGPGGLMTKASNTNFSPLNFIRTGATISYTRSGAHTIQEIKQNIITTTTLDVVSGNMQIGSYTNAAASTDFLKIDGNSVLDLRGNKVMSNLQYGYSGILVLAARVRIQHPNGLFNNTNNAAFDATGLLDYYLLPTSTVEYYGVDNQIISGWGLGIATATKHQYGNLEINFQGTPDVEWVNPTSFPNVSSVWVRNQLILTNGELNLDDDHIAGAGGKNIVIRSTTASTLPPILRTNGYIRSETAGDNGNVIWRNASANVAPITIPFAFGSGAANYVPLTLTPITNKFDSVVVSTYRTNVANAPLPPTVFHVNNLGGVDNSLQTVDRFWHIEATGTFTAVNSAFQCTASEQGAIVNPRAQRWVPASLGWALPVGTQSNLAPNGTQANNQTVISAWWTLAAALNPLPVELLSFNAECHNGAMNLTWSTGSEINNDFFTIERSRDGVEFETVATVNGAGNSNSPLYYTHIDSNPIDGINYYRLKQTDINGTFKYSDIITKASCKNDGAVKIYSYVESNMNIQVVMQAVAGEKANLNVTDLSGRLVYHQEITVSSGFNQFSIPASNFSQGMYMVNFNGELNTHSDKVFIR